MHKKRFIDYHEDLIQELKDPREAQEYLNAALQDEDERVFLLALRDVLEAQGDKGLIVGPLVRHLRKT